jgi:hypothetical protein
LVFAAQESEMDSFRVGARRALAARHSPAAAADASPPERTLASEWWRETIPEEEAFEGVEPGTVLWEQRRAALAERRVQTALGLRICAAACCVQQRAASDASGAGAVRCRRVVALEQVLEDAVAAAEEAGWEREALVVRTAEAEAAAAAAQAKSVAAAARAAGEMQTADYLRRLLSRAEQVRTACRCACAHACVPSAGRSDSRVFCSSGTPHARRCGSCAAAPPGARRSWLRRWTR